MNSVVLLFCSLTVCESADILLFLSVYLLYIFGSRRHGAHAPGVRINPGHGEHNGSGGPLPAGAKHAGTPWCSGS